MKKRKVLAIAMVLMMAGVGTIEPLAATIKNTFNVKTAESVKTQLNDLSGNIAQYENNEKFLLDKFNTLSSNATDTLTKKQGEINTLENNIVSFQSKIDELNLVIKGLSESNSGLKDTINSLTSIRDGLINDLNSAKKELEDKKKELETLTKEKQRLENELLAANRTISSQMCLINSLYEQIRVLEKNNNGSNSSGSNGNDQGNNGNGSGNSNGNNGNGQGTTGNNGNGNGLGNNGNQGNGHGNKPSGISEEESNVVTDGVAGGENSLDSVIGNESNSGANSTIENPVIGNEANNSVDSSNDSINVSEPAISTETDSTNTTESVISES